MALPRYGGDVWGKLIAIIFAGWGGTAAFAGAVATKTAAEKKATKKVEDAAPATKPGNGVLDQGEVALRSWVLLTSLGLLGHAAAPANIKTPLARFCQFGTTVVSLVLADKRLPPVVKKSFHPLVVCATSANLVTRYVGSETVPYLDNGNGVGDLFFQWLAVAVSALGFRMYNTTDKWYDDPGNLRCVLVTAGASAAAAALGTVVVSNHPMSPLKIPAPLSLPITNRSVMSALGIEGAMAIGPECDPKLSVASILITGCIGASIGRSLLEALSSVCDVKNPLVRGLSMGCAAHSIGTAALISEGDTEAAAISGATMCVSGTAHTLLLNLPGVVPYIRSLAL
jgi:putative effector of murein hydrolase